MPRSISRRRRSAASRSSIPATARTPTIELTWALILASARNLIAENASLRAGGWQLFVGDDLAGRTLGVLGLGNVGGAVARIGKAFGMDVIAWSQNLTAERAAEAGVALVTKEELFRRADIVTVHLVLSGRTRGLVGAGELALMKPTARLVNTSRGPIVVEADLISALENGRIAGAAIDVFDQEPLPADHPFRSFRMCWRRHISATSRAGSMRASTRTRSTTFGNGSMPETGPDVAAITLPRRIGWSSGVT